MNPRWVHKDWWHHYWEMNNGACDWYRGGMVDELEPSWLDPPNHVHLSYLTGVSEGIVR